VQTKAWSAAASSLEEVHQILVLLRPYEPLGLTPAEVTCWAERFPLPSMVTKWDGKVALTHDDMLLITQPNGNTPMTIEALLECLEVFYGDLQSATIASTVTQPIDVDSNASGSGSESMVNITLGAPSTNSNGRCHVPVKVRQELMDAKRDRDDLLVKSQLEWQPFQSTFGSWSQYITATPMPPSSSSSSPTSTLTMSQFEVKLKGDGSDKKADMNVVKIILSSDMKAQKCNFITWPKLKATVIICISLDNCIDLHGFDIVNITSLSCIY
jgi:hypothetical protein